MPKFALRYPYFIIMLCLIVALVALVNVVRMPVDLFPKIDMPVVVVATFYNGMPPKQIEADIERDLTAKGLTRVTGPSDPGSPAYGVPADVAPEGGRTS